MQPHKNNNFFVLSLTFNKFKCKLYITLHHDDDKNLIYENENKLQKKLI